MLGACTSPVSCWKPPMQATNRPLCTVLTLDRWALAIEVRCCIARYARWDAGGRQRALTRRRHIAGRLLAGRRRQHLRTAARQRSRLGGARHWQASARHWHRRLQVQALDGICCGCC